MDGFIPPAGPPPLPLENVLNLFDYCLQWYPNTELLSEWELKFRTAG